MSRKSGHRLFSASKVKAVGNVLELVSYWDDTVLDVDLIQANAAAKVGEIISFTDNGCTLHLLPDMEARLKKGGNAELETTDAVVHVGKDDVVHIKQGNLDFVLMFVNIPAVTLPRITKRDSIFWAMLLSNFLLFLASATYIYMTKVTPSDDVDDIPWLIVNKPSREDIYKRPVEQRIVETVDIKMATPPKVQEKPVAPQPLAPKAMQNLPKLTKAIVGKAAPLPEKQSKASAGAPTKPGSGTSGPLDLSALQKSTTAVLDRLGQGAAPIGFRDSSGGPSGNSGTGLNSMATPGINIGNKLGTTGAGDAAGSFAPGTSTGDANIGKGFDPGRAGQARADVAPGFMDPVTGSGLKADEVQRVIQVNLNQIRHCYEQLLQRSPQASGKLKVNFVVGGDGHVTRAAVTADSIGDADMANCVTGKILHWTFPVPRNAQQVNVNYPFLFNPR